METVPTSVGVCHKIGPFPSKGARDAVYACVYADQVYMHDSGFSEIGDELEANARLIASAPDLLEALKECMCLLEDRRLLKSEGLDGIVDIAVTEARALIAKATEASHD
jgi:hypothetical protein